jgi:flagellar hook-length control protein FliK
MATVDGGETAAEYGLYGLAAVTVDGDEADVVGGIEAAAVDTGLPEVAVTVNEGAVVEEVTDEEDLELVRVAALLGIPVEVVQEILYTLDITLEELAAHENARAFVQKLFGADTAGGLLAFDGAKEVIAAVKACVAQGADVPLDADMQRLIQEHVAKQTVTKETAVVVERTAAAVTPMEAYESSNQTAAVARMAVVEEIPAANREETEIHVRQAEEEAVTVQRVETQAQNPEQNTERHPEQNQEQQPVVNQTAVSVEPTKADVTAPRTVVAVEADAQGNQVQVVNTRGTTETQVISTIRHNVPANTAEVIEQIVDRMKIGIRPGVSEIRLTLKPEHLGDVSVRIASREGVVTALIVTGTETVRDLLEQGLGRLREVMEGQGIRVDEINVSVGQNLYNYQGRERQAQNGGFTRRADEAEERVEGVEAKVELDANSTVSYSA